MVDGANDAIVPVQCMGRRGCLSRRRVSAMFLCRRAAGGADPDGPEGGGRAKRAPARDQLCLPVEHSDSNENATDLHYRSGGGVASVSWRSMRWPRALPRQGGKETSLFLV
jgi:hypothetical protein